MKIYGIILAVMLGIIVTGCSTLIPSRYDDNESYVVTNLYHETVRLDCNNDVTISYQSWVIDNEVEWLMHYAELKKSRDIYEMLRTMRMTTQPFAERDQISPTFCELKKRLMVEQSKNIGEAIMSRMK